MSATETASRPESVSSAARDGASTASAASAENMAVELAYALPERQYLMTLTVANGSTVEAVIRQSGLLQRQPEIDLASQPVGIWSRLVPLSQPVSAGDRIEIYRPLRVDPATTLRQRERARQRRQRRAT